MRFCPKCGGPLRLGSVANDYKPRLVCEDCSYIFYQDPKVSACTIPFRDGKVAMVRRAINPGRGLWVYPGGYMDQDETVEEAAIRETLEEANLQVQLSGLVGIYSYRTPVVVVVFASEVVGGELRIDKESTEGRWFTYETIPWDQLAFPSTRDALVDFFRMRAESE